MRQRTWSRKTTADGETSVGRDATHSTATADDDSSGQGQLSVSVLTSPLYVPCIMYLASVCRSGHYYLKQLSYVADHWQLVIDT